MTHNDLTIRLLQSLNAERAKKFRNRHGEEIDCTQWTNSDWGLCLAGEVGELANLTKKVFLHKDALLSEKHTDLADELADILCYLVLWSEHLKIDLADAVTKKFNEVSQRVGSTIFINPYYQKSDVLSSLEAFNKALADFAPRIAQLKKDQNLNERQTNELRQSDIRVRHRDEFKPANSEPKRRPGRPRKTESDG